ncbi:MAG TPA: hypothetical protein VM008_20295 [Phycisphaerae bacterium]|nr:hypothetical protein [Phycisphaerae bacterium]
MTETITTSTEHPLVHRITRLRGRVRLVLALFGLGVVVAAAVGGMFLLMFLDYFVHIPAGGRVLLLLAWVGVLAFLAWRMLISPLMTRLTDQFLASRVENVHPGLSDELMSAVHFIHAGTYRTNVLASRHVDAVAEKTVSIRFEEAVDFRRSAKSIALALLTAGVVALLAAMNGNLTRIAMSRWFSAHGQPWPRITNVEFVWNTPNGQAPEVAPIGEQLLVRAKVVHGGYAKQYVTLTTWSDTKSATDELMTFQPSMSSGGEFVYERTLEPDGQRSFSMRLSAGDDRDQEPVTIRLAPRPVISELSASVTPPPYVRDANDPAKPAPPVISDLLNQAAHAVQGSTVAIRVKATKPFATDEKGEPEIRFMDQNKDEVLPIPMRQALIEPTVAEVTFPAASSLQARLSMRDSDSFENRVGGSLTLEVVPDALPSVVITEPRSSVERVPTASVQLVVQATDDLGLDGLKLVAEKFDSKPGDKPVEEIPLPWSERTADAASGNTTGRSQYIWNLAPMNLTPGTRLTFYAMVQDNYNVNGRRHPWVKSPSMSLQIRSEADIVDARRRELNEVKERIRTLRGQQEQTRRQTQAIQQAASAAGITTPQQKEQLAQLAQQQSEEAASANAIQQRTEHIAQDLQENNLGDGDLGKLAQSVSAGLKDVGQNNMPAAASDLDRARDAAGNQTQQNEKARQEAQQTADAAGAAGEQQQQAIAKMDNLVNQLGAAGDFEAIRGELQKIKEIQDTVGQQTRALSAQTVGKKPEELSQDLRDKLSSLSEQQKNLSNQTSDLMSRMSKAATQLKQSDPASSETLQRTAQAAQENQVSSVQDRASKSIAQNQTNEAANDQTQAQRGLQQMLNEMEKNEDRQLEQLSRDLQDIVDQLKQFREDQDGIQKATVAAADDLTAKKLGDRQGQLQRNTVVTEKRAENTKGADQAAGNIREAADHMSSAAGALVAVHKTDAIDPETKAIASLDEAIKKLQKQKDKVDSQIKEKDLAEFVQQYQAIKTEQLAIKSSADGVETRRQAAPDKLVDRRDIVTLAQLAGKQSSLVGQIGTLSSDDRMKEFAVVVWMNRQIGESMQSSQDLMKRQQTGTQLAAAQQYASDRIQDIIDSLKEEQKRQSEFKKENGGGAGKGGGGGSGGKPPLVPPLAQLKLLKAMQMVVNAQTADLAKGIAAAPDDATKARLQGEARKLGQAQGEIKDIAHKIIQDMQQKH